MTASRREFLQAGALGGAALVLGFHLPQGRAAAGPPPAGQPFAPNAWLAVMSDGRVVVTINKSEMGQGVMTSLPMLVAEELEVALATLQVQFAPAESRYKGPGMPIQVTGGSSSVRSLFDVLRAAGATARTLLVQAAAKSWSVEPQTCKAQEGRVVHAPSGRSASYGELAAQAATLPVPKDVPLKAKRDFRLIGTRAPRLDTPSKVDGSAAFGLDVELPGLLTAVVERCPVFGGKVKHVDAAAAQAVPGVRRVVPMESGVAVVADGYFAAMQGRRALKITWDEGKNAKVSSEGIRKAYEEAGAQAGLVARNDGDATGALAGAVKRVNAVYEVPYLAHAPMEPLNCTALVRKDGCELWVPTQAQTFAQAAAAKLTGLPEERVQVHTTLLGGGFGRRAERDFVEEAVQIAKVTGVPVKLVFSREDEIQHGFYRPASWTRIEAGLDKDGWPIAWRQRIVSSSIFARVFPVMMTGGIDRAAVEGSGSEMPYAVPNVHVEYIQKETGVPVGFWRSVGHSANAFSTECFTDELAAAGGHDPLVFRRRLLAKTPRPLAVLERAAKEAGWGKPLPEGRARGLAVHESFGSFVAQVAEVSMDGQAGTVKVHRVVCAVDSGDVVNPDTVEAQMQGATIFGLTAALYGAITIEGGRVVQSNFHDYPMVRMAEAPVVQVHIVRSGEPLGGIGEPGVPPLAPAVCNALYALTKRRVRKLPLTAAMKT